MVLLAVAILGCGLWAQAGTVSLVRVSDGATPMGTYMIITVYAPDEAAGRSAIAAAFQRVEEVEAATSHYREQSDLSKLNRSAGGPPLAVSPHLFAVLRRSIGVSQETDGAFDVTVGPLVALWKRTWKKGTPPSDAEAAAARLCVDYRAVRLVPDGGRVQLLKPGTQLDLGGIGKGYASDQAIAALRERGISAALVALAGDIFAFGSPPEKDGWLVGIRDPIHPGKIFPNPLRLKNLAVSTSGDYEQFGEVGGHRVSHILDPRTGKPVVGMTSVTVIAPDATAADAYATGLSVLGADAAMAFAQKHPGIEVMVVCEREGKTQILRSKGFERFEVALSSDP